MTSPKKISGSYWIIKIKENPETKEPFIEFPDNVVEQLGWNEGDTLIWEDLNNGSWSIKKDVF